MDLLRRILIVHEGMQLTLYRDTEGKLTIGVGRNVEDVGITYDEAMLMLDTDITRVKRQVEQLLPWVNTLSDLRQIVVHSMGFNMGVGKLLGFKKFLAALKEGDYELASKEMLDSKWSKQVKGRARTLATMMITDQLPGELS